MQIRPDNAAGHGPLATGRERVAHPDLDRCEGLRARTETRPASMVLESHEAPDAGEGAHGHDLTDGTRWQWLGDGIDEAETAVRRP